MGRFGALNISLGANYNNTNITHIDANPPQLASLGPSYVLFDRASQGYLTSAFPKTKISRTRPTTRSVTGSVVWRETRYGTYDILQDIVSQDRTFGAKWITDLEIDYHLNKRFIFSIGSNNLGNVYPTANGIFNATTGSRSVSGNISIRFHRRLLLRPGQGDPVITRGAYPRREALTSNQARGARSREEDSMKTLWAGVAAAATSRS